MHRLETSCRALNGIGQRQYESPILRSAVQEDLHPSARLIQLHATDMVEASSLFSSSPGDSTFLGGEEEKKKISVQTLPRAFLYANLARGCQIGPACGPLSTVT